MFFADLITLVIPATTPTKKNININQGLVPKVLSKINPIIVPTATAATNSVLNLKAVPIEEDYHFYYIGFSLKSSFLQSLSEF